MPVTIGALREGTPLETRVSVVPEVAIKLTQSGARILIEHGAGTRAQFPDSAYKDVSWAVSSDAVLAQSDVVLTVQPLTVEQIHRLKAGAVVIGFMQPYSRRAEVKALQDAGVTSFAVELIPRISRVRSGGFFGTHIPSDDNDVLVSAITATQSRTSFSASLGTTKDARKIGKNLFPVHRKATISPSAASKV